MRWYCAAPNSSGPSCVRGKIAKIKQPHGMAGGADLLVDLVAALELGAIEYPEGVFEGIIDVLGETGLSRMGSIGLA
jgi:hypothetical protein